MLAYVLLRLARIWGDDELERRAVSGPPPRSRRAAEGADRVRVAARRARPAPRAASRARDHRFARRRGGARRRRPRAATDVDRLRAGRGHPAARRPGERRRPADPVRLPQLRLRAAGHRSGTRWIKLTRDGAARDSRRDAAVRRDRGDRRRLARRRVGPDRRADRPERRRQDHALQRDHPALQARHRHGALRRQEPAAHAAAPGRAARDRAHVPERRAVPLDDRARQRARRRAHPNAPVSQRRGPRPRARGTRLRRDRRRRRTAGRRDCRSGRSSASSWRARSSPSRSCCCSTSRPAA